MEPVQETSSPLDRPASRASLRELAAAGLLSPEAQDAALHWLEPRRDWWGWTSRALLFLGAALALSGIVFFFAYNWAAMAPFLKFAILETAVLGAAVAAWKVGFDRLGGKVLLLSASFLVGVLLAVYGQVYQTGADAWELFAGWAALILGWVLVSRFAALWIMELALVYFAAILYWGQVRQSEGAGLFVLLALLAGGLHVAFEAGARRGVDGLRPAWPRALLWTATLTDLTIGTGILIFDPGYAGGAGWAAAALLLAALAAGYGWYRHRAPSLPSLTAGAAALSTAILMLAGRLIFEQTFEAAAFFAYGIIILAVIGGAVLGLRRISRSMEVSVDD